MKGFIYTGLLLIISIIIVSIILVLRTNTFFLSPNPIFEGPILSNLETTDIDTTKVITIENQKIKRLFTLPAFNSKNSKLVNPVLINDKIYYLEGNGLYAYGLENQLKTLISTLKENQNYYSLKTDEKDIYLSRITDEVDKIHYVEQISINDNTSTNIGPFIEPQNSKIEFLGNIANKKIFLNSTSDDCNYIDEIYEYKDGVPSKISEFGKGCSSLPRLIAFDKNGIYIATIDPESYQAGEGSIYDEIIYKNLVGNNDIEITKLSGLEETHIQFAAYNPQEQIFFAKTNDELLIFNSQNGELKIINLTEMNENFYFGPNDLYLNIPKSKTLFTLDYETLTLTPISYTGTVVQSNPETLQYIGEYMDKPIFSVINKYK